MLEGYIQNNYLRALTIFVIVFVVIRLTIFIFEKILPLFVKKAKTGFDDEILRRTSSPLTSIAFLIGIRFAIGEINLQESWVQTLNGIVLALIIIFGAILTYYIIDSLITIGYRDFGKRIKGRVNESLLQFFHSILVVTIVITAFLVILSSWGIAIGPLLAGVGVAGVAIAFALQSTLSNIFGGISMILDKSINVGDLINLDAETAGKILKINLRSTKIRTFDNELIIIPNSKLADSNIKNIALPGPKTRVTVPFGVAYGSDIGKVKKLVMSEIKKVNHFIDDPQPVVRFLQMGASSLDFKAYFYVDSYDNRANALDDANTRIYNALNKAKISIPFPQMDVNLKK